MTEKIPKSLIAINGEPFIAHQLKLLVANGIQRIVLCTGYLGELIEDFVGDGSKFGVNVQYSRDGAQLLGTGGALRKALPMLGDSFLVLYGDSYLPCDYRAAAAAFDGAGTDALMTIYRNEGSFDRSNIEAAGGKIVRYDKRKWTAAMEYIDYGLGVFRGSAFNNVEANEHCDLATIYQDLLADGRLASFEVTERFYEIGSAQGIEHLKTYLSNNDPTRDI